MAIKFDVEDDLTYRVDISVIAFGKEAINGVNNLLDNKINYFKYEFVNEANDYNENAIVSLLKKTDLLIVLCTDNSYEDNVYHIAELAKHNKILSINIISSIKNYMDNYEFVEEIKKILKINREFDFIETLDLGALYEKVWLDGYDVGFGEGYTAE